MWRITRPTPTTASGCCWRLSWARHGVQWRRCSLCVAGVPLQRLLSTIACNHWMLLGCLIVLKQRLYHHGIHCICKPSTLQAHSPKCCNHGGGLRCRIFHYTPVPWRSTPEFLLRLQPSRITHNVYPRCSLLRQLHNPPTTLGEDIFKRLDERRATPALGFSLIVYDEWS